MKALVLAGIVLVSAFSLAFALPRAELTGLLDLGAETLPAPPEIRLRSPAHGAGVPSRVDIIGEAFALEGDVVDVQYRVDGAPWASIQDVVRGQPSTPFSLAVELAPGDHLLETRAWDGDAYSLVARALVRRDAPTITITQPSDGESLASGSVTVRGVVSGPADAVMVEASGASAEATILPGGAWSATLPLADGLHEIRATALAAVPSLPARVQVAAASRPPASLTISNPRDGASFGEMGDPACLGGCILFAGSAREANRITVEIDGRPAGNATLLPTGAWSFRLPILRVATGPHVATFTPEGGAPRTLTFLARTPNTLEVRGDLDARPTHSLLQLAVVGEGAESATWVIEGQTVAQGASAALQIAAPGDHALEVRTSLGGGRASTVVVPLHALNRAPHVELAEPSLVGASIRLDASAIDPDGRVVAYRWELGDGSSQTTSAPRVTHRYAARGLYQANVTAIDDAGGLARATTLVLVPNVLPQANFSWEPPTPSVLDVVTLLDTSLDLDGKLASRGWTVDGADAGHNESPALRFGTRGAHLVTLTVFDELGAEGTITRAIDVVNLPPSALFSWYPPLPRAHEETLFMDNSTDPDGPISVHSWSFPDGTTAAGPGAIHTFRAPGLYNVTLSIVDDLGAPANVTLPVRVVDSEPNVTAVLHEPARPLAHEEVRFRVLARDREGSVVALHWDFGDGTNSTILEPTHRYPRSGKYAGKVTVYDEGGLSATFPFLVHVANAPPTGAISLLRGGYAALPSLIVANASDVDGRVALYRFDPDGDGDADCETTEPECLFTYAEPRVHLARVWIEDNEAAIFEAQTLVDVLAPPSHLAPPRVTIESPTANAATRGDHLFRGDAQGVRPIAKVELQLRNDTWTYSGSKDPWRLANGGNPWSVLVDTRSFADGRYELLVRATDEGGGEGYARTTIWVLNGERPSDVTLQILGAPDAISEGAEIRGSAFHPQGVTSVRWRIDDAPWRYIGTSPLAFTIPLDPDTLAPGDHVLHIEAYRGPTEKTTHTHHFEVLGEAPTLIVDEPPAPTAHGLLRASGRILGEGHAQWRLDHDVWRPLPGTRTWTLTEETARIPGGRHTLELRATSPDGKHASATRSYTIEILNPPFDRAEPDAPRPPPVTLDVPMPALGAMVALAAALALARRRRT